MEKTFLFYIWLAGRARVGEIIGVKRQGERSNVSQGLYVTMRVIKNVVLHLGINRVIFRLGDKKEKSQVLEWRGTSTDFESENVCSLCKIIIYHLCMSRILYTTTSISQTPSKIEESYTNALPPFISRKKPIITTTFQLCKLKIISQLIEHLWPALHLIVEAKSAPLRLVIILVNGWWELENWGNYGLLVDWPTSNYWISCLVWLLDRVETPITG